MSSSYDDSNGNIVILTNIPGMVLKKNWLQLTLLFEIKQNKIKWNINRKRNFKATWYLRRQWIWILILLKHFIRFQVRFSINQVMRKMKNSRETTTTIHMTAIVIPISLVTIKLCVSLYVATKLVTTTRSRFVVLIEYSNLHFKYIQKIQLIIKNIYRIMTLTSTNL